MAREQQQLSYKIMYPYNWTVQFDSNLPATAIYLDLKFNQTVFNFALSKHATPL